MHQLSLPFRHLFLAVVLMIMGSIASAQIINIENSRMPSDTTGWQGRLGTTFTFTKNVQEIINIDAVAHVQYKRKKDLYLLLANYNLLKGSNQTLSDNMFYHLRYNRKVNEWLRWEAFTQWQENTVTNIGQRTLVGTGPRFKLHDSKKLRLYAATLAMYEYEKEKKPVVEHRDWRSDNYVSFTFLPSPQVTVTSTTFYQPLFNRFSDFRILNQLTFNFRATRRLVFVTNWSYLYDSAPPTGTPKVNYSVTNGFTYVLK